MASQLLDSLGLEYDVLDSHSNGVEIFEPRATMNSVAHAALTAGVRVERDGLNTLVLFSEGELVVCTWSFTPAVCARAFIAAELINSGSVSHPENLPVDVPPTAASLLEYGCVDVDAEPLLSTAATLLVDRLPASGFTSAYMLVDAFSDGPEVIEMARALLQR
jgi:hypothetical protein